MTLPLALGEQCAAPFEAVSRGKTAPRAPRSPARFRVLQRENGLRAPIKKQHLPMKKRRFRLDAPFFSISIRFASARAVFTGGSSNF
jgi:hypothetical protein